MATIRGETSIEIRVDDRKLYDRIGGIRFLDKLLLPFGTSISEDDFVWQKAESSSKSHYKQNGKGDKEMQEYSFKFKGGSKRLDQANYKFHMFFLNVQEGAEGKTIEHILYEGKKNGIITEHSVGNFTTMLPIVKVFSSTAGFGIPKEYFSYFMALNNARSIIKIKPLGFEAVPEWEFSAAGTFLKREQIASLFGNASDTYKFYLRQSFLSRQRLSKMVSVGTKEERAEAEVNQTEKSEVRLLRLD